MKKILLLFIVLLVLVSSYFLLSSSGLIPFSIIGFTTLSISNASIVSNPVGVIDTDALLVNFVSGGFGQGLQGTFSANTLNNYIPDTYGDAQKGFTFSSELTQERCFYPYTKNTTTFSSLGEIYNLGWYDAGTNVFHTIAGIETECANRGEPLKVWIADFYHGYCIYGVKDMGSVATFNDPKHQFQTENVLTIDGASPITKYISNYADVGTEISNKTVDFGNIATLTWNGSLGSGESCSIIDASNKIIANSSIYDSLQSWKIGSRDDAVSYRSALDNILYAQTGTTTGTMLSYMEQANGYHNKLKFADSPVIGGHVVESSTAYGGSFYYGASGVEFPTFSLYIKADSLQIVQPVPIVSNLQATLNSNVVKTGSTSSINTSWFNTGATGNFSISTSCSGAFTSIDNSLLKSVVSQGQGYVTPRFSASCGTNSTGSCTVTVQAQSLFGSGNSLSKTVTGSCSPEQICEPNKKSCQGNKVEQCSSDGTRLNTIQDCALIGQFCNNGLCESKPPVQVCGDGTCSGTETWLTCPHDCTSPPDDCTSGVDCPADLCSAREGDGLFITGYSPHYNIWSVYDGCNPEYNWVVILFGVVGIVGAGLIGYALISRKGGKK